MPTKTSNKLVIRQLEYTYANVAENLHVLKGVNAEFVAGKLYAIKGESGSGKTTLLSLLSGLDIIQQGDILYNNTSIQAIGLQAYRLSDVSIVFQAFNLIKYMTAAENIQVAIDFTDSKTKLRSANPQNTPEKYLHQVGLSKAEGSRLVNQLSGGQQQRIAIARALASNTPIIVADEPTGNLDEDTEAKIIKIFQKLAHDNHKIVILVTHSRRVADQADVVYKLEHGKLEKSK